MPDGGVVHDIPLLSWEENLGSVQAFIAADPVTGTKGRIVQSYCDTARALLPESLGSGHWDFIQFSHSFGMLLNQATYLKPQVMRFVGEGLFKFHFRICANTKLLIEDANADVCGLGASVFQIFYHANGFNDCEWIFPDPVRGWVTIYCKPEFLTDELGFDRDSLPGSIAGCVFGERQSPYILNGPMQRDMRAAVAAISADSCVNRARKQYLRAKCTELVYLAVLWSKNSSARAELGYRFSKRDLAALERARLLICGEPKASLTLKDICDSVGLNRNKLTQGFHYLHGKTPNRFMVEVLMDEAQRRVLLSGESVDEISYALGYEHPNNFSTAFKREIGVTPSAFRKMHCRAG